MTASRPTRSRRTVRTLCAAVAVVASATPAYANSSPTPAPSPSGVEPHGTWTTSKLTETDANAFAVTRPDAHTTWAAGIRSEREGERHVRTVPTLWERDDRTGGRWKALPTAPLPGSYDVRFNDVDASSPRNALVVGDHVQEAGGIITQRWDGRRWQTATAPVPTQTMTAGFLSVDARTARDAWAAGWSAVPDPEHVVKAVGELQHWDGTRWTPAALPDVGEGPGGNWTLSGVTARAHDDVWAVGEAFNEAWSRPVLLHYDGTTWRKAPAPDLGEERVRLNGVASGPRGEVWAVGRAKAPGAAARGLVLRLSGGTWAEVPLPPGVAPLRSVTVSGARPVVLAEGEGPVAPKVLERAGSTWKSLDLHATGGAEFAAVDIAARGRTFDVSGKFPGPDTDPVGPAVVVTARR
ncbi:hypothetical protein [Streptomyces sp. NPDC005955]|uniref:hypothetical protein n=1 Tax=Streptomyces sp. NPDC005955 TaxID=3364738 RepID=UPI0036CC949C